MGQVNTHAITNNNYNELLHKLYEGQKKQIKLTLKQSEFLYWYLDLCSQDYPPADCGFIK